MVYLPSLYITYVCTHTKVKQKQSLYIAAVYTVMLTQSSWDACAPSGHSGSSVQANPPGDGTSTPQEGCTCLKDDGVGT